MKLPVTKLQDGSILLQEYSFAEFLEKVQSYCELGYRLDFKSNEGYPQIIGPMFFAKMQKEPKSVIPMEDYKVEDYKGEEVMQQVADSLINSVEKVEQKPVGRKPKAKASE